MKVAIEPDFLRDGDLSTRCPTHRPRRRLASRRFYYPFRDCITLTHATGRMRPHTPPRESDRPPPPLRRARGSGSAPRPQTRAAARLGGHAAPARALRRRPRAAGVAGRRPRRRRARSARSASPASSLPVGRAQALSRPAQPQAREERARRREALRSSRHRARAEGRRVPRAAPRRQRSPKSR